VQAITRLEGRDRSCVQAITRLEGRDRSCVQAITRLEGRDRSFEPSIRNLQFRPVYLDQPLPNIVSASPSAISTYVGAVLTLTASDQ
jgi:hypothetical protein